MAFTMQLLPLDKEESGSQNPQRLTKVGGEATVDNC